MTLEQINTMIAEIATALKCDYAYSAFKNGTRNRFLIFYYQGSDDLYADDINYQKIEQLRIEFYSPKKDADSENIIENNINSHGLSYSKNEVWINDEKVFMTSYDTEVLING